MKRRGMTFVEVVAAVALLAVLASTIFGAFDFMLSRQRLEQQTLGANEVANRLMLSYLDDHNAMPDQTLSVEYGPDRYRWDIRVDPVTLHYAEPANPDTTPAVPVARDRPRFDDRVRQITVRTWLSEESGGTYSADPGVPHARITRLLYPLANRNPDSFENMLKSDTGIRGYMDEILGGGDRGSGASSGTSRQSPSGGAPRAAPSGGRSPGAAPAPAGRTIVRPKGGGS